MAIENQFVIEAVTKALSYEGLKEQSNNSADWLLSLMRQSNPTHWTPPNPYCIAAALSCWGWALGRAGVAFPFGPVMGTQQCFDNAQKAKFTSVVPERGDIVIFRDGMKQQGHAGIVLELDGDDLHTIEFNTSSNVSGDQRNGEGCYRKTRNLKMFAGPKEHGLWIRGYIAMSEIRDPRIKSV
jgi:hypothetical protein